MSGTISVSSSTPATLGGLSGDNTATIASGVPSATVDVTGVLGSYTVDGTSGASVLVNDEITALAGLTLNTDGGNFTLDVSGLADLSALTTLAVTIDDGGSFITNDALLSATILSSASIGFGTGGGTDIISNTSPGSFIAVDLLTATSPITGFSGSSDVIDDQDLNYADITGYSVTGTYGGTETVTVLASDGSDLTFALADATLALGSFATGAGSLQFGSDGAAGGVAVTYCFLGGTMIATPDGEAAVESLRPGDLILTADGSIVPVRWIGINTVATRFADRRRSMPIRIRAGALGEGLPKRDLLLSPDHALCLDGILVQASALVDNVLIRQETQMPETFRYYHVELAAHDLILAEGVPAETFVDNVSRMAFDNWEEFLALCGGEPPTGEMPYPRTKSRRQLPEALRRRLAARAAQLQGQSAA